MLFFETFLFTYFYSFNTRLLNTALFTNASHNATPLGTQIWQGWNWDNKSLIIITGGST